jgi:hypothetical protein
MEQTMKKNVNFRAAMLTILVVIGLTFQSGVSTPVGAGTSVKSSLQVAGIVGTITHPGFRPRALALDEIRNRLFVYDGSNNTIYIYNATTLEELGNVATILQGCNSMVIDESQGKLYAGSASAAGAYPKDNIAVIDTASGTLLKYLATMGQNLLAKDESRDVVYVASVGGAWKIDVLTDAMMPIEGPYSNIYTTMAVNPVTHELFIANWSQNDGYLFIVNPDTLALTSIPNMNGFGVAANWIENKVYISYCQSAGMEAVCIYDRDTGTINRLHTTNDSSEPFVFNPDVNRLYSNTEVNAISTVLNGANDEYTNRSMTRALTTVGVRYSTDNVYYVDSDGTYVISGETGKILTEYPATGVSCSICLSAILINQTSGLVYVINQTTDENVTVIQDGEIAPPTCNVIPISMPGSVSGTLTATDCRSLLRQVNYWEPFYADRYSIDGVAGQQIRIVLSSSFSWEYLYLVDPSGTVIAESWGGCFEGTCIPDTAQGWFTLPTTGVYIIEVTTLYQDITGSYTLTLSKATPPKPSAFGKSAPVNNSLNQPLSPTLSWSASANATSFEYCYYSTNSADCDEPWTLSTASTSVNLSGLASNTTYHWQVRAVNAEGITNADGGTWWSFTTAPLKLTKTFYSTAVQDGWILESGQNTNQGGTMDKVTGVYLNLGDDAAKKQYRSILSFATGAALPDTAIITKVTLKVKQFKSYGTGNPVSLFGGFMADIKKGIFGTSALQLTDWQTAANKSYGPFVVSPVSGWYALNLTAGKAYINKLATNSGLTQIRLRFNTKYNNNTIANYLALYSGNAGAAYRPRLIIEYYVP